MWERLKTALLGERLEVLDPVFGHLQTLGRIKRSNLPLEPTAKLAWEAWPLPLPSERSDAIEQVMIHAGPEGPGDEHRRAWLAFLDNYSGFEQALKQKIYENYLWHRDELVKYALREYGDDDLTRFDYWKECVDAEEVFALPCFDKAWWLDIHPGGRIEFLIPSDLDIEHNLRVRVQDGQLVDVWQE